MASLDTASTCCTSTTQPTSCGAIARKRSDRGHERRPTRRSSLHGGPDAEPKAVVHTHAALWASRFVAEQLAGQPGTAIWSGRRRPRAGPPGSGTGCSARGRQAPRSSFTTVRSTRRSGSISSSVSPRRSSASRRPSTGPWSKPAPRSPGRFLASGRPSRPGSRWSQRSSSGTGRRRASTLRDGLIQAECGLLAGTLAGRARPSRHPRRRRTRCRRRGRRRGDGSPCRRRTSASSRCAAAPRRSSRATSTRRRAGSRRTGGTARATSASERRAALFDTSSAPTT